MSDTATTTYPRSGFISIATDLSRAGVTLIETAGMFINHGTDDNPFSSYRREVARDAIADAAAALDRYETVHGPSVNTEPLTNEVLSRASLEDLILALDGALSDLEAAKRKGYLTRDLPRLHKAADAIRAKRGGAS